MNQPLLTNCVGVGMTDKWAEFTKEEIRNGWYLEDIRVIADAFGYDLVPRLTAQQAHDLALAQRVAEDGPPPVTSAPGFDGRAINSRNDG